VHKLIRNICGIHPSKASLLVLCVLMYASVVHAQNGINLPFPIFNPMNPYQNLPQSFDLGDPTSMQQSIVFDPETGQYVFKETLGKNGLYYRNPSKMSLEDYLDYNEKKSQKMDWQEIIEEQSAENRAFELPIKIGSKAFTSIFGSDEIKIIPGGNLELSLGINHSRGVKGNETLHDLTLIKTSIWTSLAKLEQR